MAQHQTLRQIAGNLAQDLRNKHWSADQLFEVCKQEIDKPDLCNFNISAIDLYNKVQRAYISKLRDGFKQTEEE